MRFISSLDWKNVLVTWWPTQPTMDLVNSNMVALNALAGKLVAAAGGGATVAPPTATNTTTTSASGSDDLAKPLKPHHINNHYHLKNHLNQQTAQSQIKTVSSMQSQNNATASSLQSR